MKNQILTLVVLMGLLAPLAKSDEIFYANAYTGMQGAGTTIDLATAGSLLQWVNFTIHNAAGMEQIITGTVPRPSPVIGDTGASFGYESIASAWNLGFTHWDMGIGYATLTIDTDHPPGVYAVGTVNCTGAVIWVVLQ